MAGTTWGEQLLELDLHMGQMGPPISFTVDGKGPIPGFPATKE